MRYKRIDYSSFIVVFDSLLNCLCKPFIKIGKLFTIDSELKELIPSLRRQKLLDKVEEKMTNELDVVNLVAKLRAYDSILQSFMDKSSIRMLKYNR